MKQLRTSFRTVEIYRKNVRTIALTYFNYSWLSIFRNLKGIGKLFEISRVRGIGYLFAIVICQASKTFVEIPKSSIYRVFEISRVNCILKVICFKFRFQIKSDVFLSFKDKLNFWNNFLQSEHENWNNSSYVMMGKAGMLNYHLNWL